MTRLLLQEAVDQLLSQLLQVRLQLLLFAEWYRYAILTFNFLQGELLEFFDFFRLFSPEEFLDAVLPVCIL